MNPETGDWRTLSRSELGLGNLISGHLAAASQKYERTISRLRDSSVMLIVSDYGGAHKEAPYEVLSFVISSIEGLRDFDDERRRLREGSLGKRRMSYKALNDKVRMRVLPNYLAATDRLTGLSISIAVDKNALDRLSEEYRPEAAFGGLGEWAGRSFKKLTRIGHLAAILVEGVRRDNQNLIWITDEDEIAPNQIKHTEATRLIGHYLNSYCSGPMGHFRFGTTASDAGDLLIEDLASVPDLAAGCLSEILSILGPYPAMKTVERLFIPANSDRLSEKSSAIATWLSDSSGSLKKLSIAIDEVSGGCSVRDFDIVRRLEDL